MKVENWKKGVATAVLTSTLLTGCGSNGDGNVKNNRNDNYITLAIVLVDNTATIMEVGYYHVSGGYTFIDYSNGTSIAGSNIMIVKGFKEYSEVEEFARSLVGEDGEVNYYDPGKVYTRTR